MQVVRAFFVFSARERADLDRVAAVRAKRKDLSADFHGPDEPLP